MRLSEELEIILYLIKTDTNKNTEFYNLGKAIERVGENNFFSLVLETHLLSCLKNNDFNLFPKWFNISRLISHLEYQNFVSSLYENHLFQILEKASFYGIKIILLKGIGLWYEYYETPGSRKISDFDIQLLSPNDSKKFGMLLENLGFSTEKETQFSNHYELSAYRKSEEVPFNKRIQFIDINFNFDPFSEIYWDENSQKYLFDLIVEPHLAPFAFSDGSLPKIDCSLIRSHKKFNSANVYRDELLLPYLGTKLIVDLNKLFKGDIIKKKAFKLLCDFIRILKRASKEAIEKSLDISIKWKMSSYYLLSLSIVKYIFPEIQLRGVSGADGGLFLMKVQCAL